MRIRMSSGAGFGIFDEHIEVAIVIEDAGVHQFILRSSLPLRLFSSTSSRVGKFRLRILVEILHVGVRGRAVEVEVILLDVFAVIALFAGEAEEAFFEDGVAAIPEREREADLLMTVADAGDAVFVPAVSARAGVVVGKVFPGRAVGL